MAETATTNNVPSSMYQSMQNGIELAKNALEDVRKRLVEYDSQYGNVSTKASAYLSQAYEKAQASLGDLGKLTEPLKSGSAEIPVKAMASALASASNAFNQLVEVAHKYDETFQLSTNVSSLLAHPREQATAALATVAAYASATAESATAQLQGVSDGLRAKLITAANTGLDKALPSAVRADEALHVTERTAATKQLVVQTAKDLDEKFGLSEKLGAASNTAQSLDQKFTGGRVTPAVVAAYNMGWNMVSSIQEKFEEKKKELKSCS